MIYDRQPRKEKNFIFYPKYLFRKYIKTRFFNKIFYVHMLITVFTCLLLLFILSGNLTDIKSEQTLILSDQVLTSIHHYLESKISNTVSIHKRLYTEKDLRNSLTGFLCNSLEAIRMNLYLNGDEKNSKMVYILSDLFRNNMKNEMIVPIRSEINYVRSYLEFYQYRFGDGIQYTVDIPEEVYRYSCIKHMLQPILENSLVHGIQENTSPKASYSICLTAKLEGQDIIFTVSDDGCGMKPERLAEITARLEHDELFHDSIGIYNVNSRLRIVYGSEYKILIDSRENIGTNVTLRIKALRKKELEEYVKSTNYR